ncbi:component of oligomeric golgi complex 1 [Rhinolophus ferrumequinum]|uniref:Conserved oligomeric Golgi complex subunit 1 n=1 Tax=Rhinolophus ferrumequinum TaxID=59479 RepID=A0A7J7TC35_RHIFE|nr:component of oligomeric golgi complex 1 [Rhinolophus ferrumequinum]
MAAAAASPALKRLDLRDPAALFETHGAEEIRGLERQVRAEIEHKKEELRQMVGERYRDLIEAADTIGQMRRCAEGLVDAVKATDQYCSRLRQAGSAASRPPRNPQVLAHGFAQSLLLDDAGSILATATSWDEIEIQEEAESGSSVTSKIRLPIQPSWYVQSFLFSLCQEINRVGGHALPKVTLQEMLKSCMVQVVAAYEKLSEEKQMKKEGAFPMTQNRALQLLYDLRYLNIVLTTRGEEVKSGRSKQDSRIEKVTDDLEALIDPFDLDVFTPHLNSNLNRLVQRTSVLFGLVTGTENQFTPRSSTFNSQEPHNILPLASSQIRFGLLPLSMTSTRKARSTRSIESKAQVGPPALSRADDPVHPGSLFRQLVSEEDDSSTPSLFKLGWLSGMTK